MGLSSGPSIHVDSRPFVMVVFFKFAIVGGTGVAVNFLTTAIFREKIQTSQWTANLLGIIAGMTINYFLNRTFTFVSDQSIPLEAARFVLVALFGMLMNHALVWLLVTRFKVRFYLAKLITTGLIFFWNFGAHSTYTFSHFSMSSAS